MIAKDPQSLEIEVFDPSAPSNELGMVTFALAKVEAIHETGDLKVRFPKISEPASVKFDLTDGVLQLIIKRDNGKVKVPIFPKATFLAWCTAHSVEII